MLDYVNQYFPDILPESVLKHHGYESRPEGKIGESALFQDRDYSAEPEDYDDLFDDLFTDDGDLSFGTLAFEFPSLFIAKRKSTLMGAFLAERRGLWCRKRGYVPACCGVFEVKRFCNALAKNSPPDCFLNARLRIPFSLYCKKKKHPDGCFFGGEKGIRTPGTALTVHMISNHAPSASSDISPLTADYYNK